MVNKFIVIFDKHMRIEGNNKTKNEKLKKKKRTLNDQR